MREIKFRAWVKEKKDNENIELLGVKE